MPYVLRGGQVIETRYACSVIKREPYNPTNILYCSGLIKFTTKKQLRLFKRKLEASNSSIEVIIVNITKQRPPSKFGIDDDTLDTLKRQGLTFCPYCGCVEIWEEDCPVCGMGESEFWVRTYNNTWDKRLPNAPK